MIKVVLFDADGVILTGKCFSEYLRDFLNLREEITQPFFTNEFKDCLVGKADIKKELPKYLTRWGWKKSVTDFLELWFRSEHIIDNKLIRHIQKIRKKGVKCFIATNQEKHRVLYMKTKMGFDTLFDNIYASSYLGYMKPDMRFFEKIVYDLKNIQKSEILFWDNTLEHIKAADAFGINAELYASFNNFLNKSRSYLKTKI